jgi:hypothetical protein
MTLRSNDQFNTIICGFDDCYRGIHGTRKALLMCAKDIERHACTMGIRLPPRRPRDT